MKDMAIEQAKKMLKSALNAMDFAPLKKGEDEMDMGSSVMIVSGSPEIEMDGEEEPELKKRLKSLGV